MRILQQHRDGPTGKTHKGSVVVSRVHFQWVHLFTDIPLVALIPEGPRFQHAGPHGEFLQLARSVPLVESSVHQVEGTSGIEHGVVIYLEDHLCVVGLRDPVQGHQQLQGHVPVVGLYEVEDDHILVGRGLLQ